MAGSVYRNLVGVGWMEALENQRGSPISILDGFKICFWYRTLKKNLSEIGVIAKDAKACSSMSLRCILSTLVGQEVPWSGPCLRHPLCLSLLLVEDTPGVLIKLVSSSIL